MQSQGMHVHCTNVGASTIERSLAINGMGAKMLETNHCTWYIVTSKMSKTILLSTC